MLDVRYMTDNITGWLALWSPLTDKEITRDGPVVVGNKMKIAKWVLFITNI